MFQNEIRATEAVSMRAPARVLSPGSPPLVELRLAVDGYLRSTLGGRPPCATRAARLTIPVAYEVLKPLLQFRVAQTQRVQNH